MIQRTASENGLSAGIYFVLHSCKKLLDTSIPAAILRDLRPVDFDITSSEAFIRRRVFDMRPWLAHGLTDSQSDRRKGYLYSIISRITNWYKNDDPVNKQGFLKRPRIILARVTRGALKPSELKEDLFLDRWLSGLQNQDS